MTTVFYFLIFASSLYAHAEEGKINLNECSIYDFKPLNVPFSLAKTLVAERKKKRYFSNWAEVEKIQGVGGYIEKLKKNFYISTTITEEKISFVESTWINFVQAGISQDVADKVVLYKLKKQKGKEPIKDWEELKKVVGEEITRVLKAKFFLEGEPQKITVNLEK